jgi:hypothetical protein
MRKYITYRNNIVTGRSYPNEIEKEGVRDSAELLGNTGCRKPFRSLLDWIDG